MRVPVQPLAGVPEPEQELPSVVQRVLVQELLSVEEQEREPLWVAEPVPALLCPEPVCSNVVCSRGRY